MDNAILDVCLHQKYGPIIMVTSKTELFAEELQNRANFFKVLSHPARLQILLFLAKTRKCITGDISVNYPLTRATVNQHVKELKKAGLIRAHMDGAKVIYCLDIKKIAELEEILHRFLEEMHLPDDFQCSL